MVILPAVTAEITRQLSRIPSEKRAERRGQMSGSVGYLSLLTPGDSARLTAGRQRYP